MAKEKKEKNKKRKRKKEKQIIYFCAARSCGVLLLENARQTIETGLKLRSLLQHLLQLCVLALQNGLQLLQAMFGAFRVASLRAIKQKNGE